MLFEHILHAGPVALCLLLLSVVALALVLERLWVHLSYPTFSEQSFARCCEHLRDDAKSDLDGILNPLRQGWQTGAGQLLNHRHLPQGQRHQLCVFWLGQQRNFLNARLNLLGLFATLAPLLGLLGTVFGIIEMFKAIASNSGPVTPTLLAQGMWTAMITTALGLLIAIPALAASRGLELLTQRRINRLQDALSELDFALCGMAVRNEQVGTARPVKDESTPQPQLAAVEAVL